MTPTQAVWGNGFHRGLELGILIGAIVVGFLWIVSSRKKDVQPPTYAQPSLQY